MLALHALVRRGVNGLTYDTPLAALWPQLTAAKLGGTVADALSHRLGLVPPPADVLHSPTAMADLPARIAAVAAAPPGAEARGAEAQGGERDHGVGALAAAMGNRVAARIRRACVLVYRLWSPWTVGVLQRHIGARWRSIGRVSNLRVAAP